MEGWRDRVARRPVGGEHVARLSPAGVLPANNEDKGDDMGEYFFGLGRGKVTAAVARRVDAVARRHGADFIAATLPGEGPRYGM